VDKEEKKIIEKTKLSQRLKSWKNGFIEKTKAIKTEMIFR